MSIRNYLFPFLFIVVACTNEPKSKGIIQKTKAAVNVNNIEAIPFQMDPNHIILNAVIEGRVKARLIYDTGAGGNLYLDSTFIYKHYWLKPLSDTIHAPMKKMDLLTQIKESNLLRNRKISLKLGKIQDSLQYTSVMNLYKVIKDKADGIIGNMFMAKYIVEIDYAKKELFLHKHDKVIDFSNYIEIPIKYHKETLFISVNIDYQLENGKNFIQPTILDLGVGRDQIIIENDHLINKYNLLTQMQNVIVEKGDYTNMINSYSESSIGNIKAIKIGDLVRIDTPKVRLKQRKNLKRKSSMGFLLVGNYIFKKFGKIIIDYQSNKIYLPKNKP